MKVKAFNFELEASDPKQLKISVSTRMYLAVRGRAFKLECSEREFALDDVLDFDAEFGDTLQLTYVDLVHGTFNCKVNECEVKPGSIVLKVLDSKVDGVRVKLLVVLSIEENALRRIYADRLSGLGEWEARRSRVSRITSIPPTELEKL